MGLKWLKKCYEEKRSNWEKGPLPCQENKKMMDGYAAYRVQEIPS